MAESKLDYSQVYKLVTQLSMTDIQRLRNDLAALYDEARENSRPYTVEEVRARAREAEEDIKAGRVCMAEEGWKRLEEKFPWLQN